MTTYLPCRQIFSLVVNSTFVIRASSFKIKRMNHDEAHRHLSVSDKRLAQLISRSHRYNIEPNLNVRPFDALAESIAYQQLSGKAAATIWKRVRAIFPKRKLPTPKQMDKHGRKFQPYRSALAWYCWRALDVERKS